MAEDRESEVVGERRRINHPRSDFGCMASTQATSKILLLLLGAAFYDRASVPPTRPASAGEQLRADKKITLHERIMSYAIVPLWARCVYWTLSILEAAELYNKYSQGASVPPLTPTFLAGTAVLIAGTAIRIRCFRELGRHFTYAMSVRDNHSLVTSGPYGVVRHPAYTGGLLQIIGSTLVIFGADSWWSDIGYTTRLGTFLAGSSIVCGVIYAYACLRGAKEDEYLARTFGDQWKSWAQKVPYRYIPGIC
ncbi:hypothetical protein B0H15DRAFT_824610 [Mycena belliarum]|uniref:Protein-S-isoprenylcysteine O-methyltransferase n=1 Tax=Mycena belliarum TaxID=1033014 RepID=A0AAD6UAC7_9AGAR|nr:hypothetical protein B0H15DRAFT_824610 [Mycena belliae]